MGRSAKRMDLAALIEIAESKRIIKRNTRIERNNERQISGNEGQNAGNEGRGPYNLRQNRGNLRQNSGNERQNANNNGGDRKTKRNAPQVKTNYPVIRIAKFKRGGQSATTVTERASSESMESESSCYSSDYIDDEYVCSSCILKTVPTMAPRTFMREMGLIEAAQQNAQQKKAVAKKSTKRTK